MRRAHAQPRHIGTGRGYGLAMRAHASRHGHALRGHATQRQDPGAVIPTEGPKARSGGTRSNSASTRHPTRGRSIVCDGGER